MQIIIDTTNDLTPLDLRVLGALVGATPKVSEPAPAVEKTTKKVAEPEPEPKPEPPVEEPEATVTMKDAVSVATKLVSDNQAGVVKAALKELGVSRVSELKGDKIAAFVNAVS